LSCLVDATPDLSLHMSFPTLDLHLHPLSPNSGSTPTGDKILNHVDY
jgi:hypothetical protein